MGLMLKSQRDGTLRKSWYGVFTDSNGTRRVVNLNVNWSGTPPAGGSLRDVGDAAFERSRERATAALASFVDESKRKGRADHLTERLIESKTGRVVEYVKIADLPDLWRNRHRDTPAVPRYLDGCDARFRRFESFMADRNPSAVHLYDVTKVDASAYIHKIQSELASGTVKSIARLMHKAFQENLLVGQDNVWVQFIGKGGTESKGAVHRRPLKDWELAKLIDTARSDAFMYPLIVCAAQSGMRRADVCNLKWDAIQPDGMLKVTTSKTGASVAIPIFPLLQSVLDEAAAKGKRKKNGYVWPDAAQMIRNNPNGMTSRFKSIIARAFADDQSPTLPPPIVSATEIENEGIAAIEAHVKNEQRRDRIIAVFRRYIEGKGIRDIEEETGIGRSMVSYYLHAIEGWMGKKIVRRTSGGPGCKAEVQRLTRQRRANGQRAASVLDWHCLRTTFITAALLRGMSIDLLRKATGHGSVQIVLDNYLNPDAADYRAAFQGALPDVLTGNKTNVSTDADELAVLVGKVRAKTATAADKKRLRALAAKI